MAVKHELQAIMEDAVRYCNNNRIHKQHAKNMCILIGYAYQLGLSDTPRESTLDVIPDEDEPRDFGGNRALPGSIPYSINKRLSKDASKMVDAATIFMEDAPEDFVRRSNG